MKDGTYTYYAVEFQYEKKGKWSMVSLDSGFNMPMRHILNNGVWEGKENEPYKSFSVGAQCWQETFVRATYDPIQAFALCGILKINNMQHNFRVIKQVISQQTEVL